MRIAIIGAGLAGLASAYYLLETSSCRVTLFDAKGVGGGASGASTGLVHPYPGEDMRKSWRGHEALEETKKLLDALAAPYTKGILRLAKEMPEFPDIVRVEEGVFCIESGLTVDMPIYLEKLWQACAQKGAQLVLQKISSMDELAEYDQIIVTAGAGSLAFCPELKVGLVKGQALVCEWPASLKPIERTLLGKGHITYNARAGTCLLGSTYERGVVSDEPCIEKAKELLIPLISQFFSEAKNLNVIGCRAGVRVSRVGHYLPIVKRVNPKAWVFTALGSRGLLYHAYVAKMLVNALVKQEAIPEELCQK